MSASSVVQPLTSSSLVLGTLVAMLANLLLLRPAMWRCGPTQRSTLPYDRWDASHEHIRVSAAVSTRDFLAKEHGSAWRFAMYHCMLL